jgi:hypothetical protein
MLGRPRPRRTSPRQDRLRSPLVWLTAWALFATTLPLHSGLEQHGAFDGPTQVWLSHCKPGPARHLEPTAEVELPRCPACVLQLQTLAAALTAPLAIGEPVAVGLAAASLPHLVERAAPRLAPARAPPLA